MLDQPVREGSSSWEDGWRCGGTVTKAAAEGDRTGVPGIACAQFKNNQTHVDKNMHIQTHTSHYA